MITGTCCSSAGYYIIYVKLELEKEVPMSVAELVIPWRQVHTGYNLFIHLFITRDFIYVFVVIFPTTP